MKVASLAFSLIVASLAACSSEPAPTNEAAGAANAGNAGDGETDAELENRVRAQTDNDRRLFQLADCSVAMEAVANLYEVMAATGGDDRDELLALAAARNAAAVDYGRQALALADRMGRRDAADEIRRESHEYLKQEADRTRGDEVAFDVFLRGRGAAADNCLRELSLSPPG